MIQQSMFSICSFQLVGFNLRARRKVRGAAWVRAQKVELGGRAWAEVYCGTPEAGAWVHLDPILGTVDRWVGFDWFWVRLESTWTPSWAGWTGGVVFICVGTPSWAGGQVGWFLLL